MFENGYAHLLATINGSEGDEMAIKWLEKGGFTILLHIARATDGYIDSKKWLLGKDKLYGAAKISSSN